DIIEQTATAQRLLVTTGTNELGNYHASVNITPPKTGSVHIFAKVYAESKFAVLVHNNGSNWSVKSGELALTAAGITQGGTKVFPKVSGGGAFSVHSALVMAGQYMDDISGGHPK